MWRMRVWTLDREVVRVSVAAVLAVARDVREAIDVEAQQDTS